MIICRLQGGLGNQMLQYACTRALSLLTGQRFWFDMSFLKNTPAGVTLRELELTHFSLEFQEASALRIARILPSPTHTGNSFLYRKERQWYRFQNKWLNQKKITDPCAYRYDENVFSELNCRDYFLHGYFFSYRYFEKFRSVLLADFTPRRLSASAENYASAISQQKKSCSLHVRRGDYLASNVIGVHGLCGMEYYREAIRLIREGDPETVFFCFSDDLEWCKEAFKEIDSISYVEKQPDMLNHEDMWLMSKCTHNIIANSTFSWWGAWLNTSSVKTVIAPRQLMANQDCDTTDCYPPDWIVI